LVRGTDGWWFRPRRQSGWGDAVGGLAIRVLCCRRAGGGRTSGDQILRRSAPGTLQNLWQRMVMRLASGGGATRRMNEGRGAHPSDRSANERAGGDTAAIRRRYLSMSAGAAAGINPPTPANAIERCLQKVSWSTVRRFRCTRFHARRCPRAIGEFPSRTSPAS